MASAEGEADKRGGFRDWRLLTWIILNVNVLMFLWVVIGVATTAKLCIGLTGDRLAECHAGNVRVGMGAALIFTLWVLTDAILGALWLVTRSRR